MNQSTTTITIDGVTFLRENATWIYLQLAQREKWDESRSIRFTTYEKHGFFHAFCHWYDEDDTSYIWYSKAFFRTNELRADALRALSEISGLPCVYRDIPSEDAWHYQHIYWETYE